MILKMEILLRSVAALFKGLHAAPAYARISVLCLALLLIVSSPAALAGVWNYGDFNGPDVMYTDVTESNLIASQLFEAPSLVGNSLTFNPSNFGVGGAGPINEFADSTITTIVMAAAGQFINNIQVTEAGDYTLSGFPGLFGSATVGAAFFVDVIEIDNDPAHPDLGSLPTLIENMVFTTGGGPNGGQYSRPGDDGTAVAWTGSVFLDLDQLLTDNGVDGKVTKAELRWDNSLTAAAVEFSTAFIKKKDIGGVTITSNIPEPTTIALAALGLFTVVASRRRIS